MNSEKEDREFDKETREKFLQEQVGYDYSRRDYSPKCTCSRGGMIMTFHKDYCELNLTRGVY